jgi:hypothetical protein
MKIDRVMLSSNENINYYPFWNVLSKVYKENFNIIPTLIWFGKEDDIDRLGLSREHGDIIVTEHNPRYQIAWQTTWALFYFTKFFPDDVITIMGIDQLPLSDMFLIKMVSDLPDDEYTMLIDDAYNPIYWENPNGTSPSAYHVARGKKFIEIYEFNDDFMSEIDKVYNTKVERDFSYSDAFWQSGEEKWGMDESYSSKKLRDYSLSGGKVNALSNFGLLSKNRIECYRTLETLYSDEKIINGEYSESHLCRPYTNHINYINRMASLIPKYKN